MSKPSAMPMLILSGLAGALASVTAGVLIGEYTVSGTNPLSVSAWHAPAPPGAGRVPDDDADPFGSASQVTS
ncbi:hypothetical protein [uncultured Sphingomonas sp.]|uniref:hypothetical protein n=1 Tax=uncultured Sphingomonas sp. TaxID=158754 RepID=UPI0026024861|nr:hypothetical protein [uncultured Sphingomonas sp.]